MFTALNREAGSPRTLVRVLALLGAAGFVTGLAGQAAEPQPGEAVRISLAESAATRLRVTSPLQATYVMLQGANVVADTPFSGPVRLPLESIESIEVERSRSLGASAARGAAAGSALGVGMWQFLGVLCGAGCDTSDASTWVPAIVSGVLVGVFVGAKSASGSRWIEASLPAS